MTRAAHSFNVTFFEEPTRVVGRKLELIKDISRPNLTVVTPLVGEDIRLQDETAFLSRAASEIFDEQPSGDVALWYYTPMALAFTDHLPRDLCVYDCMDELSAFRNAPPSLRDNERKLFDRADLVFTGGQSLYEAKRLQHHDVHAFPSSIDATHFGRALTHDGGDPPDQARIPHPRIGFFGVIDERMNLDLVGELARLRPDWHFVMLGPVVKIDETSLPRRSNLHWLGQKDYKELPDYLAGWDAGFMPFALNESTRFISPTKTPEFLAAGVPLVSTPIRDVVRPYGESRLVEIAETPQGFAEAIERLLGQPKDLWRARVKRMLSASSWDKVWTDMERLMRAKLNAKGPATSHWSASILDFPRGGNV